MTMEPHEWHVHLWCRGWGRQWFVGIEQRIAGGRRCQSTKAREHLLQILLIFEYFVAVARKHGQLDDMMSRNLTPNAVVIITFDEEQRGTEQRAHQRVSSETRRDFLQ